jgi:hypothetical protein
MISGSSERQKHPMSVTTAGLNYIGDSRAHRSHCQIRPAPGSRPAAGRSRRTADRSCPGHQLVTSAKSSGVRRAARGGRGAICAVRGTGAVAPAPSPSGRRDLQPRFRFRWHYVRPRRGAADQTLRLSHRWGPPSATCGAFGLGCFSRGVDAGKHRIAHARVLQGISSCPMPRSK